MTRTKPDPRVTLTPTRLSALRPSEGSTPEMDGCAPRIWVGNRPTEGSTPQTLLEYPEREVAA